MITAENLQRVVEKHHLTPIDPTLRAPDVTTQVVGELYAKGMPVERIAKELGVGTTTITIFIGRYEEKK
jgi:hypothetical protein